MMNNGYQILLGEKQSKLSTNVDNNISLAVESENRLIPSDIMVDTINEYEQYISEKDASNKYRLIVDIHPFCSNVLFNVITEITYKEGSDDCLFFGKNGCSGKVPQGIQEYNTYKGIGLNSSDYNRKMLIRDTGYSHKSIGGLVYHCGYDIFNNHTLRANEFIVINQLGNTKCAQFNTIEDYLRDANGNKVKDIKMWSTNVNANLTELNTNEIEKHLYQVDTIRSFNKSVLDNLIETDGWVGFINPTSVEVPNYNGISLNKCMNGNNPCEQIDMYPDRTLYSFLPKFNTYRGRYEPNWDIAITYAAECFYDGIITSKDYGIRCSINTPKDDDIRVLFKTEVANNFEETSPIRLTFIKNGIVVSQFDTALFGFGNDNVHEFYVRRSEIEGTLETIELKNVEIRVMKLVNGVPCKYYFRKMKSLNSSHEMNKLAFNSNIYSDDVVQLLFAEPINTSGIVDNLGRIASELYITIVKRHKGDDLWYSGNYTNEVIEQNHCFGKVTAGLDLSVDYDDYNVHKIHNIPESYNNNGTINNSPKCFNGENGITVDDDFFIGDLVELNPFNVEEVVLEPIYHRFNTAQRESVVDEEFSSFDIDILKSDDYDISEGNSFNIESKPYLSGYRINLQPEGYYYKPFYAIKLKEFSDIVQQGKDTRIAFTTSSATQSDRTRTITLAKDYNFLLMERVTLYHKNTNEKIIGMVTKIKGLTIDITADFKDDINEYKIYKTPYDKPLYSYNLDDGTGRYLYRPILSDSEIPTDSDLYDSIFANGTHYIHKSINFYLRRQDPYGIYGLSMVDKMPQQLALLSISGTYKDKTKYEYNIDTDTSLSC